MRLLEIQALNFMRFNKVHLKDIPERGLFCIQGENESGKSTLGSLLFFAFAGTGPHGESAEQLISWEKSQMKLKINFEFNHRKYELQRQVDRDGSNFSKLICEDQTLARGNTPILEAFQLIFQYNPKELDRSFLITHRVIQRLSSEPCDAHLEYMLNINPLKALADKGLEAEKTLISQLEELKQKQSKLHGDRDQTGYNAEEQTALLNTQAEQNHKKEELEKQLESLQSQQNGLQYIQDQLAEGTKSLPAKFTEETNEQLEHAIPGLLEKFSNLQVVDKTKDCLQQASNLLSELQDYLKQSKNLLHSFESHLSEMRYRLGINNEESPESDSLMGKTLAASNAFKSSLRAKKFWLSSLLIGSITYVAVITAIFMRTSLATSLKKSPGIYKFLNEGPLAEATQALREWLKPGDASIFLLDPRFLTFGVIFMALVGTFLMVLFYRKKTSQLKEVLEVAQKEQDSLQQSYNQLLSADFKDMSEIGAIISSASDSADLINSFEQFKQDHENIVNENYRIEPIVRLAKDHLEETQQNLSLEMHKISNELEELETQLSQLVEELNTSEEKVADMQTKQDQYESILSEIESLANEIQKDKSECAKQKGLAELASGTIQHIRQRFQRALTGLFKLLMPRVTQERYSAVRVSDAFDLEVFSEERGDFVPLQLLSSGTNDLFNLIFQTLLIQAFMESRKLEDHFLFLDEPLLAVDVVRYQKLTELLPELSNGLKQIFLCRPPQTLDGAYVIETNLAHKDLIVDFSNLATTNSQI